MNTSDQALLGSYNHGLVVLSVVIAIVAAYAALDLAGRVTCMVAMPPPMKILPIKARIRPILSRLTYTGMAAMRLSAMCHWSTSLVILSVVLAVGISFVALLLTFYFRQDTSPWSWPKVVSAVLMGAAIPVMHYTGMAAASFTPSASAMGQWNQAYAVSAESLSAAAVSIVTFMVLGLAVVTSLVDRRFAAQGLELEASRRYREIVESAFDAFVGIDSSGVIIDWNAQAEATFGWSPRLSDKRFLA